MVKVWVWVWVVVLILMMNCRRGVVMGQTNCDAVVAEVVDLCKDYEVGQAPPSPDINSPCCKSLRRNRASLSCLCGRVNFAALNQRNLFFTSSICLIGPVKCV